MALGLMLQGNRYYIGLGILLVLFYAGLRKINISLHDIFANLLISRERDHPTSPASSTPRSTTCRTACACSARMAGWP